MTECDVWWGAHVWRVLSGGGWSELLKVFGECIDPFIISVRRGRLSSACSVVTLTICNSHCGEPSEWDMLFCCRVGLSMCMPVVDACIVWWYSVESMLGVGGFVGHVSSCILRCWWMYWWLLGVMLAVVPIGVWWMAVMLGWLDWW